MELVPQWNAMFTQRCHDYCLVGCGAVTVVHDLQGPGFTPEHGVSIFLWNCTDRLPSTRRRFVEASSIQSYVGDAPHAQTDFTSDTADMRRLQLASGMLQFARNQPYTSRGLAVERNNTQTKACNSFTVTSL